MFINELVFLYLCESMKIHLPNSAFLGNIDAFIKSMDLSESSKLEITANKRWISVHPVVLSMVAALGAEMTHGKVTCEKLEAASKHYFERMGLFSFLKIDSGIELISHESAGRFIPLTQIKNSNELTSFIRDMVPLLHLEPGHADPIKYVVSELARNVLEHSMSSSGAFVCSQYYPKTKTIRIGIADTGVGIKKTISMSHQAKTHLEAIKLALTPGITGTTKKEGGTDYNAGAGLFFIKSIAEVNKDFFVVYSGNAMYKLLKDKAKRTKLHSDPFDNKHSKTEQLPTWHGTVVGIDISLEKREEFTTLLDMIRDAYSSAIQARKKKLYKRARFI